MSPKNPAAHKLAKYALPLLVLLVAAAGAYWLVATKEEPERAGPREQRTLVQTAVAGGGVHRLDVAAAGEVVAARQVAVSPEVAGRVVWVNEDLVPGGIVRAGEALFRIDASDYEAIVAERQTEVDQAQAQLKQERGRVEVAEREWELFKDEVEGEVDDPSLALRRPQLESARVAVEAAKARLRRARLDLERTSVEAPFDAFVESESVDLGQLVSSQSQVATLIGTERFWVRVAVPVDKVSYIDVPGVNAQAGSPAVVRQDVGRETVEREARVARLLGDLDEQGRMARVLLEIDDPFGLGELAEGEEPATGGIPLLISSFVDVVIRGPTVDGLVEVPREAVRGGDQVYVFGEDRLLDIREVDVAWERPETVLVDEGLTPGERVVVSPIATAIEGMKLRRADEAETTAAKPSPSGDSATGGGPADE